MNSTISTLSLANNHLTIIVGDDEEGGEPSDDPHIRQLRRIQKNGLDIELYSNGNYYKFIIHDAAKTILHEFPTTVTNNSICIMWTNSNNIELKKIQLTANVYAIINKKGILEKLFIISTN